MNPEERILGGGSPVQWDFLPSRKGTKALISGVDFHSLAGITHCTNGKDYPQ